MATNEDQENGDAVIRCIEKLEQSVGSNRDTEGLGVIGVGPIIIGRVNEINGEEGTEEPAFVATRHELRHLALYWMQERLELDLDSFLYQSFDRLHGILGPEAMEGLWTEASTAFRRTWPKLTDDDWRVLSEGSDEEQEAWRDTHVSLPPPASTEQVSN